MGSRSWLNTYLMNTVMWAGRDFSSSISWKGPSIWRREGGRGDSSEEEEEEEEGMMEEHVEEGGAEKERERETERESLRWRMSPE